MLSQPYQMQKRPFGRILQHIFCDLLKGFDFHDADRVDAEAYNRVLWKGIMGATPYPTVRSGLDLRKNRGQLLKKWETDNKKRGLLPESYGRL